MPLGVIFFTKIMSKGPKKWTLFSGLDFTVFYTLMRMWCICIGEGFRIFFYYFYRSILFFIEIYIPDEFATGGASFVGSNLKCVSENLSSTLHLTLNVSILYSFKKAQTP